MNTPKGAPGAVSAPAEAEMNNPLDPQVQERLGAMLKQHYDDLVSAPVPDQFLVLLAELEAKERARGG